VSSDNTNYEKRSKDDLIAKQASGPSKHGGSRRFIQWDSLLSWRDAHLRGHRSTDAPPLSLCDTCEHIISHLMKYFCQHRKFEFIFSNQIVQTDDRILNWNTWKLDRRHAWDDQLKSSRIPINRRRKITKFSQGVSVCWITSSVECGLKIPL